MNRNSNPCRNLRKFMASVWPFLVCLLSLSVVTMAQTTITNSKSFLAGRAAAWVSDLKVSFNYGPKFPTEGQAVQFMDTSLGSPTSWQWDFGDGSNSSEQNPSHKYLTSGFRKVTLLATSRAGSKKSSKIISIMPEATIASFVFSPTTPGPGQTVQFADTTSGVPTSWQWDFGDGSTSTVKNPSHVFMKASFYTVTLISSNSSGSKQGSKTITVASTSILATSFTYTPALPSIGQAVQFTDTSAGSPTSWQWNFGDGMSSTAQNSVHNFSAAGFYNVTLTVAGSSETKSMSRSITVTPATVLDASFTYSPTSPVDGQAILFTDTSLGSPTSWVWDFADGATSTSQSPSHTYASAGSYNVILTVTSGSSSDSMSQTINVSPDSMLAAGFTYSPSSPVLGQTINFSDTSAGSPISWEWDFGDGATSLLQNPSHTYAAAGAQSITLTARAGSNSSSISKTISVTYADVIQAASPSFADVNTAISMAKSGDTIVVPAGKATWDHQLVITKGIKLIGAGIGNTVITGYYTPPGTYPYLSVSGYLIVYNPSNPELNEPFRLSGFSFNCSGLSCGLMVRNATATAITKVRVDHNRIENCYNSRPMYVKGTVFGVADNNEFVGAYMSIDGLDSTTWNNIAFRFGTANMFYFEDNTLTASSGLLCMRSEMGAIWCARYNRWDATNDPSGLYPLFDMHGNQPAAHNAAMGVEVYGNTVIESGHGVCLMDQRGGMALVYNNNVISTGSVGTKVREEYIDSLNAPINSPITEQPQHVSHSYYWGNKKNENVPVSPYVSETVNYGGDIGAVPQINRELWSENPSFDGTKDMGIGLLVNRPNTCAKGVGYWATDTKTLYVCTSANVWEAYYTPYAYPHPLRTLLSN